MKKLSRLFAFVLSAALMISILCGCQASEKKKIKAVISDFETGCNALDADIILDTLDPKISNKVRIGTGLIGLLGDIDPEEILREAAAHVSDEFPSDSECYKTVSIIISDITVNDEVGTAEAKVVFEYVFAGDTYRRMGVIHLIRYPEAWYISSVELT